MPLPFTSPEKDSLYDLFADYYDHPNMVKVKNDDDFSMYGVQLPCFLLNEKRYLIVLSPLDAVSIGKTRPLKDVRWVSLQARSLSDPGLAYLPTHHYHVKRDGTFSIPLTIHYRSTKISTYRHPSLIVEISLLHQRNHEYEYPNEGTLLSALETYQTIVQWIQ